MSLCLSCPNFSRRVVEMLRKILKSFRGEETSISDKKIRSEAKVPPVHVLVMARRLQLAAPALFALLQGDRSP